MSEKTITVVTGFTRCGTTLMMRMLHYGGIPAYADNYIGYEAGEVLDLPQQYNFLAKVEGMAVKILEPLHFTPPQGLNYRFILMTRNPKEQARSQLKFLRAAGQSISDDRQTRRKLQASLEQDLPKMLRLLKSYGCPLLVVEFEKLIRSPLTEATKISEFCCGLNHDLMARQVQERQPECLPGLMELSLINSAK